MPPQPATWPGTMGRDLDFSAAWGPASFSVLWFCPSVPVSTLWPLSMQFSVFLLLLFLRLLLLFLLFLLFLLLLLLLLL